jgi:hypothetical protein
VQRTELLGWAPDTQVCGAGGWAGVTCDASGSVIGLDLGAPLPSAVAALVSYDEMMRSSDPFPPLDLALPGPGGLSLPGPGGNGSLSAEPGNLLPGSNVTVRGSSPLQLRGGHCALVKFPSPQEKLH